MSRLRIAVIGRTGQVARALGRAARSRQLDLVCRGRPDLDVTNPGDIADFLDEVRPHVVVNAAAYTSVDRAESEQDEAFRVNADGPALLARLAGQRGAPVVHLSTDYVFDGRSPRPYAEGDEVAPLGVYGRSKAAGESAVRSATERHIILRTSWVYGPDGTNFVQTMLRLAATRAEIGVVDDQRGSPTAAQDIARAILEIAPRIADPQFADWGTYHMTGRGEATWFSFAREIFRLAAARGARTPRLVAIATADYPTATRRPANSVLDNAKFDAVFGLERPDWQDSLAQCMDRLEWPVVGEVTV